MIKSNPNTLGKQKSSFENFFKSYSSLTCMKLSDTPTNSSLVVGLLPLVLSEISTKISSCQYEAFTMTHNSGGKFFVTKTSLGFFSKCDLIRRKLRVWLHLLEKSLMENFDFCAVKKTENNRFFCFYDIF